VVKVLVSVSLLKVICVLIELLVPVDMVVVDTLATVASVVLLLVSVPDLADSAHSFLDFLISDRKLEALHASAEG
jgi:hypothetical protein